MNPPDSRGWAGIGLFVTFIYVFTLCALKPVLLADKTIDAILTLLGVGGVGLVASFYFGSSKQDKPPE